MRNLLNANLFRMKKELLFYVGLLLAAVIAVISCVAFSGMDKLAESNPILQTMELSVSGKYVFLNSIAPMNNMGLLIPILLIMIQAKDYTNGTIRNKIITGCKRGHVYLASELTAMVTGGILMLFNMVLNLVFGSIFLGYGETFDMLEVLEISVLGILVYEVFIVLAHFWTHIAKVYGCILYVISAFLITGTGSLADFVKGIKPLQFLMDCNSTYQIEYLIKGNWQDKIGFMIATSILYVVLLTGIGVCILEKKDLK